jgi:hypothetical protein
MHRFSVKKAELIFDDPPVGEYASLMEVAKGANIHLFVR